VNGDPMRVRLHTNKSADSEKSVTASQIFACRARFQERKRNLQKNWRKTNYICGILAENKLAITSHFVITIRPEQLNMFIRT